MSNNDKNNENKESNENNKNNIKKKETNNIFIEYIDFIEGRDDTVKNSHDIVENSFKETKGVSTILGDPKKAILKLSGPMIIGLFISSIYVLIDAIWVAGLGENALAAIGFISPIYLVVMGFSTGLGVGATGIISRFIAEGEKIKVDNAALHIMLLTVIFIVTVTISLLLFLGPILEILGAGITIDLALSYGNIVFGGSVFIIFTQVAYGILRGEGDVKKATYAMSLGAILNIILDPIFIFTFGWGMAGAGLATLVSLAVVSFIILYWFNRYTYINFSLKSFSFSKDILKNILSVGIPAGAENFILAILEGILIMILVTVSGTSAVAVYSLGWVVVMILIIPIIAVADAVVPVVGASFGAKKYENLDIILNYSIKLGILIGIITTVISFILAPYIAGIFTYSPDTIGLHDLITDFLRVTSLFYIFLPIWCMASSVFQGLGKGLNSLILAIIGDLIFNIIFAYIFSIPLGMGQYGVWWGLVAGTIIGSIISLVWSKIYIKRLIVVKTGKNEVSN